MTRFRADPSDIQEMAGDLELLGSSVPAAPEYIRRWATLDMGMWGADLWVIFAGLAEAADGTLTPVYAMLDRLKQTTDGSVSGLW
jgi:hypothetical protein